MCQETSAIVAGFLQFRRARIHLRDQTSYVVAKAVIGYFFFSPTAACQYAC